MTPDGPELHGFAYGEDLDAPNGRSLGFRLMAPAGPQLWGAEVEALARRLQMTPYPDHWPPTDLFCSVLLSEDIDQIQYGRLRTSVLPENLRGDGSGIRN